MPAIPNERPQSAIGAPLSAIRHGRAAGALPRSRYLRRAGMHQTPMRFVPCAAAALLTLLATTAPAQPAAGARDSAVTVAAGPQYAAGALKRFLLGTDYRAAWAAPIRVPVLDLAAVGGGLTPLSVGGGQQTKSMWLTGADGHVYAFRSVDKLASNLPSALQGTLLERLALDQTKSLHPGAALLAARLARAAGVLETEPVLVYMPDDPALGPHRAQFRNTLGTLAIRAVVPGAPPALAGAREIIDTRQLLARLAADPDVRVDAHAFLRARLFDVWIGDRDRHRGQWRWARFDGARPHGWTPIAEDRDFAFSRFDGVLFALARGATVQSPVFEAGELLTFGPRYQSVVGSTWGGRELDRRFLPGLAPALWDSVTRDLQARLTDSVIDEALRALPVAYQDAHGARIAAALRARREALAPFARAFRRLLAAEVAVHASDTADLVTATWNPDGSLALRLAQRAHPAAPYYDRLFRAGETHDVRIYLHGGGDSVIVRGRGGWRLRVIGGGDGVVVDSSTGGTLRVYSPAGADRVTGVGAVPVDRRPYRPPFRVTDDRLPPPDWGHKWFPAVLLSSGPDVGMLVGGGASYTRYGFWKHPYAYRVETRLGVATGPPTLAGDLRIRAYRLNSRIHVDLYARGSGIDVLRYHGLGNDVRLTEPGGYYLVNQRQFEIQPSVTLPLAGGGTLRVGPTAQYSRTRDQAGRIIRDLTPYGSGNFGQVGALAEVALDSRPQGTGSVRGVALTAGVRVFPPVWDVDSLFAGVHGTAVAYLGSASVPLRPVLALRAGGKAVLGAYPFHEAAFIGDQRSVRLGRQHRYGGDASLYGNAELRLRLARVMLPLPSDLGVFGLADVGRVFVSGESSDTWHTAYGGGVWLAVLDPANVVSVAVTRGAEFTGVYLGLGFAY